MECKQFDIETTNKSYQMRHTTYYNCKISVIIKILMNYNEETIGFNILF